ncbi:hypothetical protein [Arthrobacter sp. PAMC25284]|uniref:hypothetical protein n=1 Tax=Arthrobacter sp. PAMC25284 TaxID=2861279 RepID=UPI001C6265A2|nr:hypothetical protein [Arthrobacter sp. PAMC25284]QYF88483.1 hypothetical protein KY499_09285 [Arthrobacter sp. PAMC25284]
MNTSTNTSASDLYRFHFHLLTDYALPAPGSGCAHCWTDVVLLMSEMATPAEILASKHECSSEHAYPTILAETLIEHPERW